MKWLKRLFARERRGISHPSELFEFFPLGNMTAASGMNVNANSVMQLAAVYGCVRVIAETLASVPLRIFERMPDGSRRHAIEHPLSVLLEFQPNQFQTAFEFVETLQAHVLLRGNGYAFKNTVTDPVTGLQVIKELLPIHPDRVTPILGSDQRSVFYEIAPMDGVGPTVKLPSDAIFHVKGLSANGISGASVISSAREVFGNALAMQHQSAKLFANGIRLSGVLQHPGHLDAEAEERIAKSWREAFTGVDNSYKIAVLEEGMQFKEISMTAQDAQFIESRKFSWTEICALFRVPPHKVMFLERATFSNIEHQSIEFVTDTITPWARRWEQAIRRDLIFAKSRFFPKFVLQGLLRGDAKSRAEFYSSAIQNGWMNRNEVRLLEDLNRGGSELDEFLQPLNMQPAGTVEE